ncbi:MAG TPA: DUF6011 domain-containing protein [Solirubrobacteraceae bacterium]|nr:DUF6011 domain-containing protein [Solirubrobacteraceae bacterium]
MSGYEDAPATKMLATHCAVCRRPLLDALSVEVGIGPVCRRDHGYDEEVAALGDDARQAANLIVAHVAHAGVDDLARDAAVASLRVLGFRKLADRIEFRGKDAPSGDVVVRRSSRGTGYYVSAPYHPAATTAWRAIPGRRWDGEAKENFVPNAQRVALWVLLRTYYAGHVLVVDGQRLDSSIPAGAAVAS